jgi:uncharacterized protein YuzE
LINIGGRIMKVSYDTKTDTVTVVFKEEGKIAESDEDKPGVILDYDQEGNLVSLEILDASKRVSQANKIEFETMAGFGA